MRSPRAADRGTQRLRASAVLPFFGAMSIPLLAACSSNGSATSVSTSTTAPTPTTVVPQSTVATTIPFDMAKNARQDVTTTRSCTEVKGLWVLSGVVKNSATSARTYQIVVDFVTQPGDTVLDTTIVTTASVNPGAGQVWSTKSAPGLAHVACVIRQVQAPA